MYSIFIALSGSLSFQTAYAKYAAATVNARTNSWAVAVNPFTNKIWQSSKFYINKKL